MIDISQIAESYAAWLANGEVVTPEEISKGVDLLCQAEALGFSMNYLGCVLDDNDAPIVIVSVRKVLR